MNFKNYISEKFYDEYFDNQNNPRIHSELLVSAINNLPEGELKRKQEASNKSMNNMGITFRVYGQSENNERAIPFDIIPRIISGTEWNPIENGLKQRILAINLFINDVYNNQNIIKDNIIPRELIESSKGYLPQCLGLNPPKNVWAHVTGTDLIRNIDGEFYVLEDNLCVPSGVSYALINRTLMKRNFPEIFDKNNVRQIIDYPNQFSRYLYNIAPVTQGPITTAILTPGIYNSAYFEHAYLAQQMGAILVEGQDLVFDGKYICARTVEGLKRIDIIYRRIDDQFLDPECFRSDSVLGCKGLMKAYREGNITIANSPGTGVADDKVIYAFIPKIIKYYLNENPIINNVPTRLCYFKEDLIYTLDNLEKLVVKPASECGGSGILIGPNASKKEIESFKVILKNNPRNFISQPTLNFSRAPVLTNNGFEGRHIDLRPFILFDGDNCHVLPGGLTRVALKKGSLIVNSSQGGGTKDTWITDI